MKWCVVGSGAREHALAWRISFSPNVSEVFVSPGNAVTQKLFDGVVPWSENHDIFIDSLKKNKIDVVVIGPENPLANGLVDSLQKVGIKVFGPNKECAKLESSKVFAKEIMKNAKIPTADFYIARSFGDAKTLTQKVFEKSQSVVIKASGLAQGKGVFVCFSRQDVEQAFITLESDGLKQACDEFVIEELLVGRECSYFVFLSPHYSKSLGFAVDYKRLKDNNEGPNTGGMGCYTPVPWLHESAAEDVEREIVQPLLQELKKSGLSYEGCLYVGLMHHQNKFNVVEFNVRLGDPEAEVLAMTSNLDYAEEIMRCLDLQPRGDKKTEAFPSHAIAVVMASAGYPFASKVTESKGIPLELFARAREKKDSVCFSASIDKVENNLVFPGKGRCLVVVGGSDSFQKRSQVYDLVHTIKNKYWPDAQIRQDIGSSL